ncbi:translation initiation factor IF-2-like isoform X2 [Gambusia affinis]|uniref:translation initiation factor IF-2-like isoform X2 n=1 Tax=Gambusia affinis TaxID=33528 RepID=UPI001CDD8D23|nr:translation initiation factor IF-2-like isoform X2 [Gambusia affinis]
MDLTGFTERLCFTAEDAPLPLPRRRRPVCGPRHGDEPDLQAAGGELGAMLSLRLPGAQQAAAAPQHPLTDPQHPAAGAGAQHQPGHDPPAHPQGAASDAAAGPVRPAGGGRGARHDRDHHHHGNEAQSRPCRAALLLLPVQPQSEDPAKEHPERPAVGSPAAVPRRHHRLPAGVTPPAGQGGKQHAGPGPLPEGGHGGRSRLLAEHRHQVPAAGLAAAAGEQLQPGDQRLQQQGRGPGRHISRAWRGGTATVHRSEDSGQLQAFPAGLRTGLRRGILRDPLLPLPAHRRLRGVWLGLDHRPQALPCQLLLRGVRVPPPAAVSTRTPGEQGQPAGLRRALLHTHQDVPHKHALLQPQGADHLRQDPVHGGGQLWLLVKTKVHLPVHE